MKRDTLIKTYKNILNEVINNINLSKIEKRGRPAKFNNFFI